MTVLSTTPVRERLRIVLGGAVQGVGFRPTVYRLAEKLRVAGWVRNSGAGLEIEVEGNAEQTNDGGVFQNVYVTERSQSSLEENGFQVFTHHQVPANDGGLALGQAVSAGAYQA